MSNPQDTDSSSFVIDTSAAINLEHSDKLHKLVPPGDWLIIPSGVAKEMNPDHKETPLTTKKWLKKGKITHFTEQEEALYRKLILHPAVDDGEAQAIAVAHYRKATLVIDEKKSGEVWKIAQGYGVKCMDSEEFWDKLSPKLPGF